MEIGAQNQNVVYCHPSGNKPTIAINTEQTKYAFGMEIIIQYNDKIVLWPSVLCKHELISIFIVM